MKKIMFSDKFGLTDAVLECRKIMTRRFVNFKSPAPTYKIGEEVAIAQKYRDLSNCDAFYDALHKADPTFPLECIKYEKGYDNKMNVKALWMPHRIRIVDVKTERLQDISEDDAMREGVFMYDKVQKHHEFDMFSPWSPSVKPYKHDLDNIKYCCTARAAFSYLINKMMGRGTWESNPWVYVYEFRLSR